MFKAAKVDTLAVNHTVRQLFRETLLGFLDGTKIVFNRLEKHFDIHLIFIFTSFLRWLLGVVGTCQAGQVFEANWPTS